MKIVTSYRIVDGKVIKTERPLRKFGVYPADELPFHQRILKACYDLECQNKLPPDLNNKFVRDVHKQMDEYGNWK
jgi:hypothetical protein